MATRWPDIPYDVWRDTCSALHLYTQIVGKYRLAQTGISMRGSPENHIYNTLTMLEHLMSVASPNSGWRRRMVELVESCPVAKPDLMGFPEDWRRRPAWRLD